MAETPMTTTRLYLDRRSVKRGKEAPLKVAINKRGDTALIPLDVRIFPTQWDAKAQKVIDHPQKQRLNAFLAQRKGEIDNIIRDLTTSHSITGFTATQIKNKVMEVLDPKPSVRPDLFVPRIILYSERCKASSTKEKYSITLKHIRDYCKDADELTFDMMNKDWLLGFEGFLTKKGQNQNTRNIYLRCVRAIFNDARDNGITECYPFRKKFKITPAPVRKRSLSLEELRTLFDYPCEPWQQKYLDLFKISFMLIGINTVDLCLTSQLIDGRVVYYRAKTGRYYSIKAEPEVLTLLHKYAGRSHLVRFAEGFTHYTTLTDKVNKALKKIGPVSRVHNPKYRKDSKKHQYHVKYNGLFPELSMYWARHTWATIAYTLDIPNETIAASLGHGYGNDTTAIYITPTLSKVDEANRKVLDYVLYGKR